MFKEGGAMTVDIQKNENHPFDKVLLQDLKVLIEESRSEVIATVNATLTMLYWQIGKRINEEILKGERAEYGKQIVSSVARQLQREYGKGFSRTALTRMCLFHQIYHDLKICATLSHKLSWSHFIELIPIKDDIQRQFYSQMCYMESWSVRTLRKRIDSMLYERTVLSGKPEETIKAELAKLADCGELSPNLILKDPYVLDFLQLNDRYFEKDLEDAILRDLEQFLLEMGAGFTFIARQKRIVIDNEDFYIDLKLGDFKAAYKGQIELYLRWLAKNEQEEGEQSPLGLILCAGKKQEQIELLELNQSGIHVAEYLTVLPPKALLQSKLNKAIQEGRKRLRKRK